MLDLSHMPGDTGPEAAAFLREVWQLFPKDPQNLITNPNDDDEEGPNEH